MKKVLDIVVPAVCSVAMGSALADEKIIKRCARSIPARIREIACCFVNDLGGSCRVLIGPEVRLEQGQVQFHVVVDIRMVELEVDVAALKLAIEKEFGGTCHGATGKGADEVVLEDVEWDWAVGDLPGADRGGNQGAIPEGGGEPAVDAIDGFTQAMSQMNVSGQNSSIMLENNLIQGPASTFAPFCEPATGQQKSSGEVAMLSDQPPLEDVLVVEEIVDGCTEVVGAHLVGSGFPLVLSESAEDLGSFAQGVNLSDRMASAHIRFRGLWVIADVRIIA